jgi:hypothetical protein
MLLLLKREPNWCAWQAVFDPRLVYCVNKYLGRCPDLIFRILCLRSFKISETSSADLPETLAFPTLTTSFANAGQRTNSPWEPTVIPRSDPAAKSSSKWVNQFLAKTRPESCLQVKNLCLVISFLTTLLIGELTEIFRTYT